jgi:formylglycine-generating enzyme required for sulfatase activity
VEFVSIPRGISIIGTTQEEAELCVREWADRLADVSYTPQKFRAWILKEVPRYSIELGPFQMGRFPVSNDDYREFMSAEEIAAPESIIRREIGEWPVWGVSYEACCCFADWMSAKLDQKARLPTEAEWEYAARGPDGNQYPYGNEFMASKCNTIESGIGHPTPVDRYASFPSGFGICDMAGNVEEWTSTRYYPYPGGMLIEDDLTAECGKNYRILRGGSFARSGDLARCARRHGPHPSAPFRFRGFRLLLEE